jgi:hypothetical protein
VPTEVEADDPGDARPVAVPLEERLRQAYE